jgi:methyl-accepting chemotaxis protein
MTKNLKFSHKILLAAALVVAVASPVSCCSTTIDNASPAAHEASMQDLGSLTVVTSAPGSTAASSCSTPWPSRSPPTARASQPGPQPGAAGVHQQLQLSYFGGQDGSMQSVPAGNRAADYDPRVRLVQGGHGRRQTIVTEPYIAASPGKLVITVATPVQQAR